jgi:hypothetical protein
MKKIILSIVSLAFFLNVFAQDTTPQAYSRDYYLQKSKNQRTAAWVLLGVGTTLIVVGAVTGASGVANSNYPFMTDEEISSSNTSGVIVAVGAVMDVASIPFFISAGKNNRRAYEVDLSNENVFLLKNNFVASRPIPAITFRIHF